MHELTFYRQTRHDRGVRTGLELDDVTLLGYFEEGQPDLQDDPLGTALLWYVDIRCRADHLATEPEDARQWLLGNSAVIQEGLERFADVLSAGVDDSLPLRWNDFPTAPAGVQIEVVCSAIRRMTARGLGEILREIAVQFPTYLRQLSPLEPLLR
jgi:hypothetical protein